jgi:hypothetical protein
MLGDFPTLLFTLAAIFAALFFARSRRREKGDGGVPPGQVEAIALAVERRRGEGEPGGVPPGQGESIAPLVTAAERKVLEAIAQAGAGATMLDLYGARIGDAAATQLAGMLRENETVTVMHLARNQIGNEGARALADGLRENATVTEMHLAHNQIGDEGARALADGLRENVTVKVMDLYGNRMRVVAVGVVAVPPAAAGGGQLPALARMSEAVAAAEQEVESAVAAATDEPRLHRAALAAKQAGALEASGAEAQSLKKRASAAAKQAEAAEDKARQQREAHEAAALKRLTAAVVAAEEEAAAAVKAGTDEPRLLGAAKAARAAAAAEPQAPAADASALRRRAEAAAEQAEAAEVSARREREANEAALARMGAAVAAAEQEVESAVAAATDEPRQHRAALAAKQAGALEASGAKAQSLKKRASVAAKQAEAAEDKARQQREAREAAARLVDECAAGNAAAAKKLLAAGADVNVEVEVEEDGNAVKRTPVSAAAVGGHKEVLAALLEAGAAVDGAAGAAALVSMCRGGHTDIVVLLAKAGADKDAKDERGETALQIAEAAGHTDMLTALARVGAVGADTAALKAACRGRGSDLEAMARRVAAGDDADAKLLDVEEDGKMMKRTPLYAAVVGGHAEAVFALLAPGEFARQAQWTTAAKKAAAVTARKAAAPAAVRTVLDGGFHGGAAAFGEHGKGGTAESMEQNCVARDVAAWLVAAHASAHADPATKRLARLVLGVESFAKSMERLGVYKELYKGGLGAFLHALGAPLAEAFVRDGLRAALGDLTLPPHVLIAADQARCAAAGRPHVLRSDIEGVVPLPAAWDFSEPVARQHYERVFMHMLVLMAIVLNEYFHEKMRDVLDPFVVADEGIMQKNKNGSWRLTPQKGVARMEWCVMPCAYPLYPLSVFLTMHSPAPSTSSASA